MAKLFIFLPLIILIIAGCSKPSPHNFLPDQCQVPGGFNCDADAISVNGKRVSFNLGNLYGYELTDISISVAGCSDVQGKTTLSSPETSTYTMECDLVSGKRFSGEMTINFKTVDGRSKTEKGKIGIKG